MDTFSYIFYFPTCIVGPTFEFIDFINFINREKEYENIPFKKCIFAAFKQIIISLICMGGFLFFGAKLSFGYLSSSEYGQQSLFYKICYILLSGTLAAKFKYYTAFKLAEASVIFTGLSYNKIKILKKDKNDTINIEEKKNLSDLDVYEEKEDFYKIFSIDILKFEFEVNLIDRINNWNKMVHHWLKYNIFLRLVNSDVKFLKNNFPRAALITFILSAFWHGFFPGYYLFFVQLYVLQQTSKMLDEKFDFTTKICNANIIIQIFWSLLLSFFMNYVAFAFYGLYLDEAMKFYSNFYFAPSIILFVFYFILNLIKGSKQNKKNV